LLFPENKQFIGKTLEKTQKFPFVVFVLLALPQARPKAQKLQMRSMQRLCLLS
jgi:hypothetical protein